MTMTWRRWFVFVALFGISALLLWFPGWYLLKRSQWLQHLVQQQLATQFGESLAYERLEASLAGVHLSRVSYAPPAQAFAISSEEITVRFRLWDVLISVIHPGRSANTNSKGFTPGDSLKKPLLAGYRLDISITNPCLILAGDWSSRLRRWVQSSSLSPAHDQLDSPLDSSLLFLGPSAGLASDAQFTQSATLLSSRQTWDFAFLRRLEVKNGKILLDPQDDGRLISLVEGIDGGLDPNTPSKNQTDDRDAVMKLDGKLLGSDHHNLAVRAPIKLGSGRIDSIHVELQNVELKKLDGFWKSLNGSSPSAKSQSEGAAVTDSIREAIAAPPSFAQEWEIGAGMLNGRISLNRRSPRWQEKWKPLSAPLAQQPPDSSTGEEILPAPSDRPSLVPPLADFQVSGALTLRDGAVQFSRRLPIRIEAINCDAEIREGKLYLLRHTQRINQQLMQLSGTVTLNAFLRPELDLVAESDSLITEQFLFPFFQGDKSEAQTYHEKPTVNSPTRVPIRGRTSLKAHLTGSLRSPNLDAEISSSRVEIYGQSVRHLTMQLSHHSRQNDGAVDSTLRLVQCSGVFEDIRWHGWGELNLLHAQLPLRMNLKAGGELTPAFLNSIIKGKSRLPYDLPRCDVIVEAQIFGPLKDVKATGQFTLRLLNDQPASLASSDLPGPTNPTFLGNFAFHHDTLRIEGYTDLTAEKSRPHGRRPPDRQNIVRASSTDPHAIELSGEVWHLSGFSAGQSPSSLGSAERPLFKVHATGVQLLPVIWGQHVPPPIFSALQLDAYLQGHADSMNIRVDGRHKKHGYTLFQLFSYLRLFGRDQRYFSGDLKLFPGAHNEIDASYSAVWKDSVFYLTDRRLQDWLVGGFEVGISGNREIKGGVKITHAEISRVLESVAREVPHYNGNLFGELRLGGTLDFPFADAEFWIFDAVFNGIGKFSISGKARMDARGWEISNVDIRKNDQPFLQGTFGYQPATRAPHVELRAHDIEASDFLGAVAGISPDIFSGRASFELKTTGATRSGDGNTYVPLTGFVRVQNGRIVWFAFDELLMMDAVTAPTTPSRSGFLPESRAERNLARGFSYLTADGIFFNQVRYKKNEAFALEGSVFLPFNLRDAVNLSLTGEGNFLAVLPDFTSFFQQTASTGHLDLNLVGPYKDLTLRNTYLRLQNGYLKMSRVIREVHDIAGEAFVDSRGSFIEILNLEGKIGDATLSVRTQESPPPFLTLAPRQENGHDTNGTMQIYQPLRLGGSQLQLGTLLVKSSENGLLANIPGLMERHETGRFVVTGQGDLDAFLITGPWAHPLFKGRLVLDGVRFMFPFDENAEPADSLIMKILLNINWDVVTQSRKDNRYVKRVPSGIDNVYVNFDLDDDSALRFTGIMQDSSLRIEGRASSTRGTIEYLDLNFRVEKFGAEFDKSDWRPIVYGRAWTVVTDSTNFPYNVYLTLYTVDPITREEVARGRFQNAYFKLTSDNPNIFSNTQEQILATLGYSVENVRAKATEAVGISTDNRIFRPLIRPVERQLERHLGLDMVRLSSRFTRNFLVANFSTTLAVPALPNEALKGKVTLAMLQSTRLLIGKYLWSDLYLRYIGQVEVSPDEILDANLKTSPVIGLSLRHTLGLEYRINPAMLLQFEYDYNPLLLDNKDDRKIWLRHSFPVEFSK